VLPKVILLLVELGLFLSYSSSTTSPTMFFIFPTSLASFASFTFNFQLFSIERLITVIMHTARFFIVEVTVTVFRDPAETKLVCCFIFHLSILIHFSAEHVFLLLFIFTSIAATYICFEGAQQGSCLFTFFLLEYFQLIFEIMFTGANISGIMNDVEPSTFVEYTAYPAAQLLECACISRFEAKNQH
jgi:hypothetical protein